MGRTTDEQDSQERTSDSGWLLYDRLKALEQHLISRAYGYCVSALLLAGWLTGAVIGANKMGMDYAGEQLKFVGLGVVAGFLVAAIIQFAVVKITLPGIAKYFRETNILQWVLLHGQELLREQGRTNPWTFADSKVASSNARLLLSRFVQRFSYYRRSFERRKSGMGLLGKLFVIAAGTVVLPPFALLYLYDLPGFTAEKLASAYGYIMVLVLCTLMLGSVFIGVINNFKQAAVAHVLAEELAPTEELCRWAEGEPREPQSTAHPDSPSKDLTSPNPPASQDITNYIETVSKSPDTVLDEE